MKSKGVLRDLGAINGFVFVDNTNLNDSDTGEDLLHMSYIKVNANLQIILLMP